MNFHRIFTTLVLAVFLLGCRTSHHDNRPIEVLEVSPANAPHTVIAPMAARSTSENTLRIGSWNIEHLGNKVLRSGPAEGVAQKPEDLADYIAFSEVDVLGLIEIYGNASGSSTSSVLDSAFDILHRKTGAIWRYTLFGKGRQQLVGIAWNTQRVEMPQPVRRIVFPNDVSMETEEGKKIWHRPPHIAKFKVKGDNLTDFAVIVLHMKADYRGDFSKQRKLEAEALCKAIPQLRQKVDNDLILIGDVNAKGHAESCVQTYTATGFQDLNSTDAKTHWQFGPLDRAFVPKTQPEFEQSKLTVVRQDFQSRTGIAERDFKISYSDHFMIWTDIHVLPDDDE